MHLNRYFEGSKQVAASSQILAQGSATQASSIEQVTSAINEIAEQTKKMHITPI